MNRPINLWPLPESEINRVRVTEDNRLIYELNTLGDISSDDILHYKRLDENGFWGKSLIEYQKDMISLGLNGQRFAKDFYEKGATADVVIKHPGKMTDPAKDGLKKQLDDTRADRMLTGSSSRTLVLQEGMEIEKISFSLNDASFIESQQLTAKGIAGLWRVPLEMIGYTENSNNSIAEQAVLNYVKFGLTPWITMMEEENNKKLFRENEKGQYYTKHNVNAIMRGDIATRFESYAKMLDRGVYSINDVLDWEDLGRVEHGDQRFIQINNVLPLDKVSAYADTLIKKQLTTNGKGAAN
jgi:HK97 family phage portal protein